MSALASPALWLGAACSVLFVLVFTVDGWTRPGYRPLRHAVSALATGPLRWVQTANFILCGLGITIGAVGLPTDLGSLLLALVIAVFGLSLVASGLFPMDPMRGYPPGTSDVDPLEFSRRHQFHDWAGVAVFGSLPLAALFSVFVIPDTGWQVYAALTGAATLAGLLLFGHAWEIDHRLTGLVQRITIIIGWAWVALLFARAAVSPL